MESQKKRKASKIKIVRYIFGILKQYTWFSYGLIALVLFLLIKLFIFEIVVVNSEDMADTLHKGDLVLVNKMARSGEAGDLLYFEYPAKDSTEKKTLFIQRCAAGPGDTLLIKNKTLFVNGIPQVEVESIKYNYIIDTDTFNLDSTAKLMLSKFEGGSISKKGKYGFSLTKQQVDTLNERSFVKLIELRLEKEDIYDERVFPYSRLYNWNADNFGFIYIPKKNDSLAIDTNSIKIYRQLIGQYEKNRIEIKHDSIFINETLTTQYKVKQNYYFVLGDNRDNAVDSRRWGFLPQSYIKGKVITAITHKVQK